MYPAAQEQVPDVHSALSSVQSEPDVQAESNAPETFTNRLYKYLYSETLQTGYINIFIVYFFDMLLYSTKLSVNKIY